MSISRGLDPFASPKVPCPACYLSSPDVPRRARGGLCVVPASFYCPSPMHHHFILGPARFSFLTVPSQPSPNLLAVSGHLFVLTSLFLNSLKGLILLVLRAQIYASIDYTRSRSLNSPPSVVLATRSHSFLASLRTSAECVNCHSSDFEADTARMHTPLTNIDLPSSSS